MRTFLLSSNLLTVIVLVWPVDSNKGPRGRCVTSTPTEVGRRTERKRQKLVGRDKGGLTEQKMKPTITTMVLIRRICKINHRTAQSNSHCPIPSALLNPWPAPLPLPSVMAHSIEYPICLASLGQPAWLYPLPASGEN